MGERTRPGRRLVLYSPAVLFSHCEGLRRDCTRIAWELGIVGGVVGHDRILQSYVILLLVIVSLCSISGLHCDFARPCNPILVPFVLPPIVRPGFVRTCMDCRIGTGLPRYCNTILVPIILRPFVPIGLNRIVHGLKDPGRILPLLVRI